MTRKKRDVLRVRLTSAKPSHEFRRYVRYEASPRSFTMADDPFAKIARAVENMDRIRREREVSSRIRAVEATVREAGRECQEVEERLRKLKPRTSSWVGS
jgi:hypothetical protein